MSFPASQEPSVVSVGYNLYCTPLTAARARETPFCVNSTIHFVEIGSAKTINDNHISVLHSFCEYMQDTVDSYPGQPIVICPEDSSDASVATACLLCGAYLLLSQRRDLAHVLSAFEVTFSMMITVPARIPWMSSSIADCWRALDRARALRWLGAADEECEPMLDVEMAAHYARMSSNGNVHVLVPGKLLLC